MGSSPAASRTWRFVLPRPLGYCSVMTRGMFTTWLNWVKTMDRLAVRSHSWHFFKRASWMSMMTKRVLSLSSRPVILEGMDGGMS